MEVGAARDWRALAGGRIFITGGTGFVGSLLLEGFLSANKKFKLKAEAVVLSRDPKAFAQKKPHLAKEASVRFQTGDVRFFRFSKSRFSHLIHGAADMTTDCIVRGTERVLEFAALQKGADVLFLSSGAVYGRQPADLKRIPEDFTGKPDPNNPGAAYALGKVRAEELCRSYFNRGMRIKIARCFAFIGPYLPLDAHYAAGNFIRDGFAGGPVRVKGDGKAVRSYLYSMELTEWLWAILFRGRLGRPYNVGSEKPVTILELARKVASAFSPKPQVLVEKKAAPGTGGDRYVPSVERARRELGLGQKVNLGQAIRKTIAWHKRADKWQK